MAPRPVRDAPLVRLHLDAVARSLTRPIGEQIGHSGRVELGQSTQRQSRVKLLASVAATVLLLAACSSTHGSATTQTTASATLPRCGAGGCPPPVTAVELCSTAFGSRVVESVATSVQAVRHA